ncbi:translation initiation factor IF-2-like [Prionailurus viverrinus]|uniref:translation initiation factor IF-2-like n=1 Tax=Prionailurus viverrinus TaxID=61388 RepID=UPI001FF5C48A|nr:translation initiation factor IF-2-like [Prionailurus viverrinus]
MVLELCSVMLWRQGRGRVTAEWHIQPLNYYRWRCPRPTERNQEGNRRRSRFREVALRFTDDDAQAEASCGGYRLLPLPLPGCLALLGSLGREAHGAYIPGPQVQGLILLTLVELAELLLLSLFNDGTEYDCGVKRVRTAQTTAHRARAPSWSLSHREQGDQVLGAHPPGPGSPNTVSGAADSLPAASPIPPSGVSYPPLACTENNHCDSNKESLNGVSVFCRRPKVPFLGSAPASPLAGPGLLDRAPLQPYFSDALPPSALPPRPCDPVWPSRPPGPNSALLRATPPPDPRQGSCSLRAPQRGGAAQGAGFSGTFWAPRTLGSRARRPETSLRSRRASRTEAFSCSPRRPLRQRRHGQMGPGGPALDRGGAGGRDQCEQLALVRPGGGRGFRASSSAAAGGMVGPLCEHRAPRALRGGVARPLGPRRSLRRAGPAQVQRILPAPAAAQRAAVNKPQDRAGCYQLVQGEALRPPGGHRRGE